MFTYVLCFIAGGFLPLAFSPFNIYSMAFLSPAVLCYKWLKTTPKQASLCGFYYGMGCFGVGTSWVYVSIHTFGNTSALLAFAITVLFTAFLSLYFTTQGYFITKIFQHKSNTIKCLLVFPASWVLWEFIRSYLFTGFPWLLLGYTQLSNPIGNLLPVMGTYGVSFCVALIAGSLVLLSCYTRLAMKITCVFIIGAITYFGWFYADKEWTIPQGSAITTSIIQGNIAQSAKWDQNKIKNTLDTYKTLSESLPSHQLIVWPEAAIPTLSSNIPQYIKDINALGVSKNSTFLVGSLRGSNNNNNIYNSLLLLGNHEAQYDKIHLVPFGEYTPFSAMLSPLLSYFAIPMSDLSSGQQDQRAMRFNNITLAPFICYEIAFPQLSLQHAKHSNLLVVVNDDAWFGESLALGQHLQMAQVRAKEFQRDVIFASNTGISAIIDSNADIKATAPINKQDIISDTVISKSGKTPLMRWGYWPIFLIIMLLIILSFFVKDDEDIIQPKD